MAKTRLLVVGAGGHGRSVAEAAELSGQFFVVGFLDDSLPAGETVLGLPVLGSVASMTHHRAAADHTANRKINRERLMLQNDLLRRDLKAIEHEQPQKAKSEQG